MKKRKYHRVGYRSAKRRVVGALEGGRGFAIARAFGKWHSGIASHLAPSGGIRPAARRRSARALSLAEREEISRGVVAAKSVRSIALALAQAPSTISPEICRNGGEGRYRAADADKRAWKQALRPKPCKLALHPRLRQAVVLKLKENWSPEEIAGWLRRKYPRTEARRVSHETIYRCLYVQARGVLKKELMAHLRSQRR